MGGKYVVRRETDIWGNDQTVIRHGVTAYDVGSAIGLGAGLLVAAHKNSQMKAGMNSVEFAQKHLENGDYGKAIISANNLIRTSDKEMQIVGHIFRAEALAGLSRYDEAIANFTTGLNLAQALNQTEAVAFVFVERGICYYRKNDLAAAMRDFTSYIRYQPNDDSGYYWQGLALMKLGDLDQALDNLSRAVSNNPGDAANYRERADVYIRRHEMEKAIRDLSSAITLNPQDAACAACYRRRAELYVGMSDDARAIADFSRALELAPDDIDSLRGRAAAYQRTSDATQSAADMAKLAKEEPLQATYQEYLQAANVAYDTGITAVYNEADATASLKWGLAIVNIILTIVGGLFAMSFCASFAVSVRESPTGVSLLVLVAMAAMVWSIIATMRSRAANKAKAATTYLEMRTENEARMPGFEEFFKQFLQAKNEARLQELRARTRPLFESGLAKRRVLAHTARS